MNKDVCDACGKGPVFFMSMSCKTVTKKKLLGGILQRETHDERLHEHTEKKLCEACYLKGRPAHEAAVEALKSREASPA